MAQWKQIRLETMRLLVRFLALFSGLRILHYRELWCRLQMWSDLVLLWLWCRLAATALNRPLAWELTYARGTALKRKKKKNLNCGCFHHSKWGLAVLLDAHKLNGAGALEVHGSLLTRVAPAGVFAGCVPLTCSLASLGSRSHPCTIPPSQGGFEDE